MYEPKIPDRRIVLVTGGSGGIGSAICNALAQQSAVVIDASIDSPGKEPEKAPVAGQIYHKPTDVTDPGSVRSLFEWMDLRFGGIDILINNAAINPVFGPLSEATPELFDKIMHINVKSCFQLSNLCYPHLKKRGGGSIINIASVEGLKPGMGLGIYSVSKAALIMLTQNQAREWGADGIRANAICPGLIQTKFSAALWQNEQVLQNIVGDIPAGRMGQAEEIAGLAVFLASDAAGYCTGSVYTADGGYVIS